MIVSSGAIEETIINPNDTSKYRLSSIGNILLRYGMGKNVDYTPTNKTEINGVVKSDEAVTAEEVEQIWNSVATKEDIKSLANDGEMYRDRLNALENNPLITGQPEWDDPRDQYK